MDFAEDIMNKISIIYASRHHGNTRKLVEGIAENISIDLIDASHQHTADLSPYALIGFASGISFGKFYAEVENFLVTNLPSNKEIFFLYTCAKTSPRFALSIRSASLQKNATIQGEFGCRGYNTYGPWKLIGGMNNHHPNTTDIENATQFIKSIQQK